MKSPSIRSIGITCHQLLAVLAACLLLTLTRASAATLYVDVASTNAVPPFTTWANAAAVIQDAVDAAVPGDEIVVTNGVYQTGARAVYGMSNRVAVTKPVTVRSVNGPASTSIVGHGPIGENAIRCVHLTNGAVLAGFTLTNGATLEFGGGPVMDGGGVRCAGPSALVSNCVLIGNSAAAGGGGISGGTLYNCTLTHNSAGEDGGGAHVSTLNNCTLTGNSATSGGGAFSSTLNNCTVASNTASSGGGAYDSTLNNCTLTGNSATYGGGSHSGIVNYCTLTGNSAADDGGGGYDSTFNNCIVYYNRSDDSFVDDDNYSGGEFNFCSTTPAPESGVGNITNAPLFVDTNGWSNLRLQSNSPCINAGNNAYVTTSTDLDGRPRVVGGSVDIGAYEWQGAIRYVSAASTNPIAPYSSWASAAVTIQDAVDAAVDGDEIVVTNGVYQTGARAVYGMSNRVAVTKPVTVRSVNGPAYTSIVGHGPIGDNAIRCAYLTNGAVLAGFTLTNGATQDFGDAVRKESGGGIWCEGLGAVLSNCVVTSCSAFHEGGGAFFGTLNNCTLTQNAATQRGGGACNSRVNDCSLTGNSAWDGGGAAWSILTNCVISENSAWGYGGGAIEGILYNCTLSGNSSDYRGGGAYNGTLNNCMLTGNSAASAGGGAWGSTLNNCMVTCNSARYGAGAHLATLNNCVVAGNSAEAGGGVFYSTLNNCIVYYNTSSWFADNCAASGLNYSCTTPDPGSGVGNITNAPLFVDTSSWSNLRLQSNSPCINSGNNAYVTAATDLDGLPRIAGGTVDIGAYEFQSPASTISYAWLQQSGLPTDGSADHVDTDHDRHNNWQEWVAGTDPTNALSALRLAQPVITPTHVTLTWTSVTNRTYTLEQATNSNGAPAFSVLRSNLAGLPGTTSWTDTNAAVSSPRFYQLRVSP